MVLWHTPCCSKRSVFSMIDESEPSAFQPLRDSGGGARSNGPGRPRLPGPFGIPHQPAFITAQMKR